MAIRELAAEEFDAASGAGVCNDIYTSFTAGFGAVLGSAGGPAGTVIGGVAGTLVGGWLGETFCVS